MSESRLARKLNLSDAVTLGLGSMIGAGIFAAAAPAAKAAGSGLLIAIVVFAALAGGGVQLTRLSGPAGSEGVSGILQAAGLLFFAFAGYARIATLGEEVLEPKSTIPKAIVIALGLTLLIYLLVLGSAVLTVSVQDLAVAKAPLVLAMESGRYAFLSPVVRIGACFASVGVLLSLMTGISRTVFSMSANADLPIFFSAVHPARKVPHRAELATGIIIAAIVGFADLRDAIGFSSFAILMYYAIANLAALKLSKADRLWPRWMAWAGLLACLVIAFHLPVASILGGAVLFCVGAIVFVRLHYTDAMK